MKKRKRKTVVTTHRPRKQKMKIGRQTVEAASLIELGRVHERLNKIGDDIIYLNEKIKKQDQFFKEIQSMMDLILLNRGQEEIRKQTKKSDLVDIDLRILDILESHGPMSARELAQKCGFRDRSSFQKRYLKPMVKRKILDSIKRGRKVLYRMSETK